MADWNTVRYDKAYPEPLDEEIIPICDALNEAGFETTCSCCGHGQDWARVWFQHKSDARVEDFARFVMESEKGDYRSHFTVFQKEIHPIGHIWVLEVHCNDVYSTTPSKDFLNKTNQALNSLSLAVKAWHTYFINKPHSFLSPNRLVAEPAFGWF